MCPTGYQVTNGRCEALTSNSNVLTNSFQRSNSIQGSASSIVCPVNYCYNGVMCVPYTGTLPSGQVSCPPGYSATTQPQANNSIGVNPSSQNMNIGLNPYSFQGQINNFAPYQTSNGVTIPPQNNVQQSSNYPS